MRIIRGNGMLRKLISKAVARLPELEKAYWRRHKHNGRVSKLYDRKSLKIEER